MYQGSQGQDIFTHLLTFTTYLLTWLVHVILLQIEPEFGTSFPYNLVIASNLIGLAYIFSLFSKTGCHNR